MSLVMSNSKPWRKNPGFVIVAAVTFVGLFLFYSSTLNSFAEVATISKTRSVNVSAVGKGQQTDSKYGEMNNSLGPEKVKERDPLMDESQNVFWATKTSNNASMQVCGHGNEHTYSNITESLSARIKEKFPLLSRTRLVTYGDDKFYKCLARHVAQGTAFGFSQVELYCRGRLADSFMEGLDMVMSQKRGGGYWVWKYHTIMRVLQDMEYGDFMYYSDCGDVIHANDKSRKMLERRLKIVKDHNKGPNIAAFRIGLPEKHWTTKAIFDAFTSYPYFNPQNRTMEELKSIADSYQREGGRLIIQKTKATVEFYDHLTKLLLKDPMLITDKYNKAGGLPGSGFKDNRHDQSIMSVGSKLAGALVFGDKADEPVTVHRKKYEY
eukprot:Nk52_evm38s212 gene=Nk52_evmTU38s212